LAQAYLDVNKFEASMAVTKNALQFSIQTGNLRQQGLVYIIISRIEIENKNYKEAIIAGEKAYSILTREKDLLREKSAATNLAEAYKKIGNLPKALEYLKISANLNDSLLRKQFANETAGLQSNFELKQKNKEIELLNKEKELEKQKQQLLLTGAIVFFLMAFAGIGFFINRNKMKQRMKELEMRNQIAADLHDEVGSSLSSIHMLSQMAAQPGNEASHQQILEKMTTNSKETMDKMGDIVWMIKSGDQETGTLKQRIETFAYEMAGAKNIALVLQIEDIQHLKLSMENKKHIYLIFKEAINNAVKYSGTEKIVVTTALKHKKFFLDIKDFGKGFDVKQIKKGNGLDNMQNRATAIGGQLHIDSDIENGTTIQLQIPV
jgi:signal transduction histidine kinase